MHTAYIGIIAQKTIFLYKNVAFRLFFADKNVAFTMIERPILRYSHPCKQDIC